MFLNTANTIMVVFDRKKCTFFLVLNSIFLCVFPLFTKAVVKKEREGINKLFMNETK